MNSTTITLPAHDDAIVLEARRRTWLLEEFTRPRSLLLIMTVCFVILEILFKKTTKALAALKQIKIDLETLKRLAHHDDNIRDKFEEIKTQNEDLRGQLLVKVCEAELDKEQLREEMNELKDRHEEDQQHIIHETAKMMVASEKQIDLFRGKMNEIRETVLGVKRNFEEFACKDREEKMRVLDASEEILKKMQEIVEASIERRAGKEAMDVPGGWI
jgi:DNA anti-recombination protein RmuC